MEEVIKKAKIGDIIPVCKDIENVENLDFFAKLSNYGRSKNSVLFEFNDMVIGSADPCLKVKGYRDSYEIIALNNLGSKILALIKNDFKFCKKATYNKNKITGTLRCPTNNVTESQRLRQKNHMEVLRKVAFKFKPKTDLKIPFAGLFGMFSYDFYESLIENNDENTNTLYEFYFLDNLFVSKEEKTYIIANAIITDNKNDKKFTECQKIIQTYQKAINKKLPAQKKLKEKDQSIETDTEKDEFVSIVSNIKRSILEGDIYQAFPQRQFSSNINADPFDIYKILRTSKPRSYMFYFTTDENTFFGSSPEMCLKVDGEEEKTINVSLISGTKPIGDDIDIENKYEAEMKIDFKEISRHIMEIDIIRNDIAKVSKLGTRHLNSIFRTEKYPHEQSVVSNISGTLKNDLDALHAYLSCMNRLSGCPRTEAVRLLSKIERSRRDFFYGCMCYLTPDKNFEGTIIKNSINITGKKATFSINANIIYDTVPSIAFKQTEKKSKTFLNAIKEAGGLKWTS